MVNGSLSASLAVTVPTTAPSAFGLPSATAAPSSLVFVGLILTVTDTGTMPPCPSSTVMVNVSILAAGSAVAAACRAWADGV